MEWIFNLFYLVFIIMLIVQLKDYINHCKKYEECVACKIINNERRWNVSFNINITEGYICYPIKLDHNISSS